MSTSILTGTVSSDILIKRPEYLHSTSERVGDEKQTQSQSSRKIGNVKPSQSIKNLISFYEKTYGNTSTTKTDAGQKKASAESTENINKFERQHSSPLISTPIHEAEAANKQNSNRSDSYRQANGPSTIDKHSISIKLADLLEYKDLKLNDQEDKTYSGSASSSLKSSASSSISSSSSSASPTSNSLFQINFRKQQQQHQEQQQAQVIRTVENANGAWTLSSIGRPSLRSVVANAPYNSYSSLSLSRSSKKSSDYSSPFYSYKNGMNNYTISKLIANRGSCGSGDSSSSSSSNGGGGGADKDLLCEKDEQIINSFATESAAPVANYRKVIESSINSPSSYSSSVWATRLSFYTNNSSLSSNKNTNNINSSNHNNLNKSEYGNNSSSKHVANNNHRVATLSPSPSALTPSSSSSSPSSLASSPLGEQHSASSLNSRGDKLSDETQVTYAEEKETSTNVDCKYDKINSLSLSNSNIYSLSDRVECGKFDEIINKSNVSTRKCDGGDGDNREFSYSFLTKPITSAGSLKDYENNSENKNGDEKEKENHEKNTNNVKHNKEKYKEAVKHKHCNNKNKNAIDEFISKNSNFKRHDLYENSIHSYSVTSNSIRLNKEEGEKEQRQLAKILVEKTNKASYSNSNLSLDHKYYRHIDNREKIYDKGNSVLDYETYMQFAAHNNSENNTENNYYNRRTLLSNEEEAVSSGGGGKFSSLLHLNNGYSSVDNALSTSILNRSALINSKINDCVSLSNSQSIDSIDEANLLMFGKRINSSSLMKCARPSSLCNPFRKNDDKEDESFEIEKQQDQHQHQEQSARESEVDRIDEPPSPGNNDHGCVRLNFKRFNTIDKMLVPKRTLSQDEQEKHLLSHLGINHQKPPANDELFKRRHRQPQHVHQTITYTKQFGNDDNRNYNAEGEETKVVRQSWWASKKKHSTGLVKPSAIKKG
jgi:hypothetical protein